MKEKKNKYNKKKIQIISTTLTFPYDVDNFTKHPCYDEHAE